MVYPSEEPPAERFYPAGEDPPLSSSADGMAPPLAAPPAGTPKPQRDLRRQRQKRCLTSISTTKDELFITNVKTFILYFLFVCLYLQCTVLTQSVYPKVL